MESSLFHVLQPLYGFAFQDAKKVNEGFRNKVYIVQKQDESYILRITSGDHRSSAEIQEELDWVYHLYQFGVPVSIPLPSKSGSLIESFSFGHSFYHAVLFQPASGKPADVTNQTDWNASVFFQIGATLGRMHEIAKNDTFPFSRNGKKFSAILMMERYFRGNNENLYPVFKETFDKISTLPQTKETYGFIHNDFHVGNFFIKDGGITVFDFDDCSMGHFAKDIAALFYHAYWQATASGTPAEHFCAEFLPAFAEGYRNRTELNREVLAQVPLFLKWRELFLYALFHEQWDLDHLQEWQSYTLKAIKHRLLNDEPYADVDWSGL